MAQFFTTKELERYLKENYIDHLLTYMGETEDRYGKGFIYYHEESTNDYEGTFIYSDVKGYHYEEGKDYRRPLFENERKLWKLLDERGYERKCKEIAEILEKYPYVDTVGTELECSENF